MYLEYVDFGSKVNRGCLKHMKVDNKVLRQPEDTSDTSDADRCVVIFLFNIFSICQKKFIVDDGFGVPRFGKQPVGLKQIGSDHSRSVYSSWHQS